MKRLLYLFLILFCFGQSLVNAKKTESEELLEKAFVELGCRQDEARIFRGQAEEIFKKYVHDKVQEECKRPKAERSVLSVDTMLRAVSEGLPFKVNLEASAFLREKVTQALSSFYKDNHLSTWKNEASLRTHIGLLKKIFLDCMRSWLIEEFTLPSQGGAMGAMGLDNGRFLRSLALGELLHSDDKKTEQLEQKDDGPEDWDVIPKDQIETNNQEKEHQNSSRWWWS